MTASDGPSVEDRARKVFEEILVATRRTDLAWDKNTPMKIVAQALRDAEARGMERAAKTAESLCDSNYQQGNYSYSDGAGGAADAIRALPVGPEPQAETPSEEK